MMFRKATKQDEALGRSFWTGFNVEPGSEVNLYEIKKAMSAAISASHVKGQSTIVAGIAVDAIDPNLIRKSILNGWSQKQYAQEIEKSLTGFVDNLNTIKKADLTKAGWTEDTIKKAADSTSNLMHSIYDQDITELFMRPLPVQALIGKEANMGAVALWDAIPAGGAGSASYGPESPNLVESDMDPARRSADIKIAWTTAAVTQFAQYAGMAQVPTRDLMSIELLAHTEMLKQLRERRTLGVTSSYSADPAFAPAGQYEPKGLYELITANTGDPNYVTAGAGVDTWDELNPLIKDSNRMMRRDGLIPNCSICDFSTYDIICQGLEQYVRYAQQPDQSWGVENITINLPGGGKVPVVPSIHLPTTSGTNGSFFLLDLNRIKYRVLYPEVFTELAPSTNPTKRFTISFAETLIDKSDVDGTSSLQGGVFGIAI
jgi:hypothetical protein